MFDKKPGAIHFGNDTIVKIEDVEDFFNTSPEERKKFIVKL